MNQNDYATIIACIQHGAPALAEKLISGLNTIVEGNNSWIQYQRDLANQARLNEEKKRPSSEPKAGTNAPKSPKKGE